MRHLSLHVQSTGAQVQVVPLQRAEFAPPQPRGELQQRHLKEVVFLRLDQETADLILGEHLHLRRLFRRQLTADGGIHRDQSLRHRLLQRRVAGGVAGAHHAVGESRTVYRHIRTPTVLFQGRIELLQVALRQLVQRDLAEAGNDVQIDAVFVAGLRGDPQRGLGPGAVPEVHPVAEGHVRTGFPRDHPAGGLQRFQLLQALRL